MLFVIYRILWLFSEGIFRVLSCLFSYCCVSWVRSGIVIISVGERYLLCFRYLSESRFFYYFFYLFIYIFFFFFLFFVLGVLHWKSKFPNFCHDLMQNHLS